MSELLLAAASYTVALTLGRLTLTGRSPLPASCGYFLILFALALGTAQLMAAEVLWRPPEILAYAVKMTTALAALLAAGLFWLRRSSFLPPDGRSTGSGLAAEQATNPERELTGRPCWSESPTDCASCELDADGRVVVWDANAGRLTGYRGEEMAGRAAPAVDTIHDSDRHRWQEALAKAGTDGRAVWEGWRLRKDKAHFWARDVITRLAGPEGAVRGYYAIIRDLSEQRKLQEQLLLSQRSESIGQLAGGVAHDFNNHLTVISGYSDLLQGRLEEGSALAKQVEEIKKAAKRATALTRQLLVFTRRAVIETQQVDPNAILGDLMKMIGRLLGEDIEMDTVLDAGASLVEADPGQLEQILLCLAIRARSEMPLGGKLLISTRNLELNGGDERLRRAGIRAGRYALVAADWSARTRETNEGGEHNVPPGESGSASEPLGWDGALQAVEEMGGGVCCSALNGRTRVEVYLPALVSASEGPAGPRLPPALGTKDLGTILVVEDEDAVRSLIESVLHQQGYQVLAAHDPLEAREMAARHGTSLRLLLTDIVMPSMSGPDLARELSLKHRDLKVLFISGYASQRILDHGFQPEESILLKKPFDPAELARMVRRVLAPAL